MALTQQLMSGRWTQYGVQGLEAVGVDVESLCQEVGLSYEALTNPTAWIDHAQFAKLWSNAVRACGDPDLGLRAAEHFRPAATDLLLHLLISCKTLGEGIERATSFFELAGDLVGPKFARRPMENVFQLAERKADHSAWVEFRLAAYWRFAEMATQQELRPVEVRFRHAGRGKPTELYERVYRCPVRFSAIENCLVLPEEILAVPLPNACEETADALQKAASVTVIPPQHSSLEGQVRLLVRSEMPGGDFSESAIARSVRMSERTLKRRLAEVEWSFSDLVDDVRRRLVLDLLVSTPSTLEEVAREVGYASAGSLVRAVKRWTGYTPASLRDAKVDARSA
jgi:AraC-like DNA-binding protein